jgi:hypothetical protein
VCVVHWLLGSCIDLFLYGGVPIDYG